MMPGPKRTILCPKCDPSPKPRCLACKALVKRLWRASHKEQELLNRARYRQKNHAKILIYDREYHAKNREKEAVYRHKYHFSNRDKLLKSMQLYYATKLYGDFAKSKVALLKIENQLRSTYGIGKTIRKAQIHSIGYRK